MTLHVPLRPDTRHLISTEALEKMKRTAYLINTTRGPVVDEAALAAALEQGKIAGAALDVYEREPQVHPALAGRKNVVSRAAHRQRDHRNAHENGGGGGDECGSAVPRPPSAQCVERGGAGLAGTSMKDLARQVFREALAAVDIGAALEKNLARQWQPDSRRRTGDRSARVRRHRGDCFRQGGLCDGRGVRRDSRPGVPASKEF